MRRLSWQPSAWFSFLTQSWRTIGPVGFWRWCVSWRRCTFYPPGEAYVEFAGGNFPPAPEEEEIEMTPAEKAEFEKLLATKIAAQDACENFEHACLVRRNSAKVGKYYVRTHSNRAGKYAIYTFIKAVKPTGELSIQSFATDCQGNTTIIHVDNGGWWETQGWEEIDQANFELAWKMCCDRVATGTFEKSEASE